MRVIAPRPKLGDFPGSQEFPSTPLTRMAVQHHEQVVGQVVIVVGPMSLPTDREPGPCFIAGSSQVDRSTRSEKARVMKAATELPRS